MSTNRDPKNESQQAFLRVVASDGHTHLLPYGHLIHVEFIGGGTPDGIKQGIAMRFAVHSVLIDGSGLEKILEKIQNMTLAELSTRGSANVTKIEVNERKES